MSNKGRVHLILQAKHNLFLKVIRVFSKEPWQSFLNAEEHRFIIYNEDQIWKEWEANMNWGIKNLLIKVWTSN